MRSLSHSKCAGLAAVLLALVTRPSPAQETGETFRIGPSPFTVGEPIVVEMAFEAPETGIAVGGSIYLPFYMKAWNGLMRGLSEDKQTNTLVSAARSDAGDIAVNNVTRNPQWDILSDLKITIAGTPLAAGQTVTVRLGDEAHPVTTSRKQANLVVEARLDASGDGRYQKLEHTRLRVRAGPPVTLHMVGPSYAVVGEPVPLVIYGEDRFGNVVEDYTGPVTITWPAGAREHQLTHVMQPWPEDALLAHNEVKLTFNSPGVVYVEAEDRERALHAVSNPVRVLESAPKRRLYWGEIHVHSQVSDGRGELADLYRDGYARGLDFIAITDHGFGRGDRGSLRERLDATCDHAERFNRPGDYITIPAGETHYLPGTHVNLYFAKADPDHMQAPLDRLAGLDLRQGGETATPEQRRLAGARYWEAFGLPVYSRFPLAFPHHTMWIGLPKFSNDDRQRLIEIHSTHGSSETRNQADIPEELRMKPSRIKGDPGTKYSVREILDAGQQLGFVGGSDDHDGQPGRKALTGVFAEELTRESILGALYERRCYATSANRTLIDMTIGGAPMGQSVKAGLQADVAGLVAGDGGLGRVEIIRNGEVVRVWDDLHGRPADLDWELTIAGPGYCYVRALLDEDGAAWSSPVFIEP